MKQSNIEKCIFGLNFYNEQKAKYAWVDKNAFAKEEIKQLKEDALNELKIPLNVCEFFWPTLFCEDCVNKNIYILVKAGKLVKRE